MQKIIKSLILLIFIFVIGIFYFSLNKNPNYDTENLVGKKIPEVSLENFNGSKALNIADVKDNEYMLINFWASWCGPCRIEHPLLMKLSKENNIKILGVNFKDKKKSASKFLKDLGNPYDFIAKDELGKQSIIFGIYGIPESILINHESLIIKKYVGPISLENFNEIKKIINSL